MVEPVETPLVEPVETPLVERVETPLVGEAVCRGRVGRAAPAAVDLGSGGGAGGPGGERPAVAARTRHISVEAAGFVDAAMAPFVDGSLPWVRFETRLDGKVVAADPEVAAELVAARVAEQFAKRTRSSEQGTAGFYVRFTAGVIARIEATVAFLADAPAGSATPTSRTCAGSRRSSCWPTRFRPGPACRVRRAADQHGSRQARPPG